MGCDIHLHIEIKLKGSDQWQHYACPNLVRNYTLFAKMAGVRTDDMRDAIVLPKGLPEDITEITKVSSKCDKCYHDQSWLSIDEIMILEDWIKVYYPSENLEHHILHCYLFGNSFTGPKRYPSDRYETTNVRFVFWFDN